MNAGPAAVVMWAAFWLFWALWALKTNRGSSRWTAFAGYFAIAVLIGLIGLTDDNLTDITQNAFHPGAVLVALGFIVAAGGLGFACWARVVLGRNWSGTVKLLPGQHLVRTGPFKVVRHPIYAGLLAGFAGTALLSGNWGIIWVFAVIFAVLALKSRSEERLLLKEFPQEYASYRAATRRMIVPFLF